MPPNHSTTRRERVEALTALARQDPKRFYHQMRRVLRRGALYVNGVLGGLLLILTFAVVSVPFGGGAGAALLLWIMGGSVFVIFRSMRLWSQPPEGVTITREDAPQFFALLDEVQREARVPNIDVVLITNDLNAAVTIVRTRGLIGKTSRYLIVGLPLFYALPLDEFKAVIAHECAHLSERQATDITRIWQLQTVWRNVALNLTQGDVLGGVLFRPFFKTFLPEFLDYSLVFLRELERDADHHGMTQTSAETAINLEARLAVLLDRQPLLVNEAMVPLWNTHSEPPNGLTLLNCQISARPFTEADEARLQVLLTKSTGWADSHPALKDRIASYNVIPSDVKLPSPPDPTAATVLLGAVGESLGARLDAYDKPRIRAAWQQKHQTTTRDLEELHRINHDERFGDIDNEDRKKRALLVYQYEPERAQFALSELEALDSDDPDVLYAIGTLRLRSGDATGLDVLQRVESMDSQKTVATQSEMGRFYAQEGQLEDAALCFEAASDSENAAAEVEFERWVINNQIAIQAHELDGSALSSLRDVLHRTGHVEDAWLVQRSFSQPTHRPAYVLMVRDNLDGRVFFLGRARHELFDTLNQHVSLSGEVAIIPLSEPLYGLWRRMEQLDGAHVFSSGEETS